MKYIIFKTSGLFHPVMFPEHTTHSTITMPAGAVVDSAGFFTISDSGILVGSRKSVSLDLHPKMERDRELISAALAGFGTYMFLDHDYEYETGDEASSTDHPSLAT